MNENECATIGSLALNIGLWVLAAIAAVSLVANAIGALAFLRKFQLAFQVRQPKQTSAAGPTSPAASGTAVTIFAIAMILLTTVVILHIVLSN